MTGLATGWIISACQNILLACMSCAMFVTLYLWYVYLKEKKALIPYLRLATALENKTYGCRAELIPTNLQIKVIFSLNMTNRGKVVPFVLSPVACLKGIVCFGWELAFRQCLFWSLTWILTCLLTGMDDEVVKRQYNERSRLCGVVESNPKRELSSVVCDIYVYTHFSCEDVLS